MVGSVLMQRMQEEKDFDHIEPVFFSTSNAGGTAPAALSAANEVVVEAFLAGRIMWADIARYVGRVMEKFVVTTPTTEDDVLAADAEGRRRAIEVLEQ